MASNCFATFLLVSASIMISFAKKHHVVYWNSLMTPELSTTDFVLNVKIGEFMDILCPQTSLMGITHKNREMNSFDIFNVTKEDHESCETGESKNLIFSCNKPERENKLTIKFQQISPSPLGFRFQACRDYYLLAQPSGDSNSGCRKETTRLRISVACKDAQSKPTIPTTKNLASTHANKYDVIIDKILNSHGVNLNQIDESEHSKLHETILIPKLLHLKHDSKKTAPSSKHSPKVLASVSEDSGHGSASTLFHSTSFIRFFLFAILATIFPHLLSC